MTLGLVAPAKCATTTVAPLNVRVTCVSPAAVPHLYTAGGPFGVGGFPGAQYVNVTSVVNAPEQSTPEPTVTLAALCTSFAR